MPITLVPDEPDMMTEDAARAYLLQLSSPTLNAFRASVSTKKTSELIGLLGNPELIAHTLGFGPVMGVMPDQAQSEQLMAAMLAVADEIDRRMPIPL